MELLLRFADGVMTGEGRDWVGRFTIRGHYRVDTGACTWTKHYIGRHDVFYRGYNEGRGIWGIWELTDAGVPQTGGFHIWPIGSGYGEDDRLHAAQELPLAQESAVGVG
ncbi:MAG: hypothetical protein C4297_12450 [Gemmataceae bacterium]